MLKKLLIFTVSAAMLVAAGTGLWVWQGLETLEKPLVLDEPLLLDVPEGAAFSHVARTLERQGLVSKSLWLRLYGRLYPEQARIKAGEYEITNGMTALGIIGAMVAGDTKHWSIQFIEGWTFNDMRMALARAEHIKQVTAGWSTDEIMKAVGAEDKHPEGRFFPDTYLYTSSESDLDLLKRAYEKMANVLAE
ncbi:MAG TPA: endolytic transglycosylase MltG, partial [Marinobacter sp.]|nr:endolytic transglycosylase MltG [Marinobacter sp.]